GLKTVTADVEPYRRIERRTLVEEDVDQFVVEILGVGASGEVSAAQSPVGDGLGHAAYERAHAALALGSADLSVKIFAGHDVGGRHRPVFGDLDVLLLEDGAALGVSDRRGTPLPLELLVG